MKKVTVSVPGKVHLMGEHAVVYGKPALLAAINLRLSVTIEEQTKKAATKDKIVITSKEPTDHVRYAIDYLLGQFRVGDHPPIHVSLDSKIPAGFHLGSSAAVAVAITGAVMYFFKKLWNPIRINELAYEIEKKQHGTPSGGDNTTVTVGGFVWFRKELEFLKSIWQLPFRPHPSLNHFFLINTGRPKETTGEMISMVKEYVQKKPEHMQKVFDLNEVQVKRVTLALKAGNEPELVDALRVGERTLEDMGVVSDTVIPLIRFIEETNGAAKILGGGGKKDGVGFLLCYHKAPHELTSVLKEKGFVIQDIQLGEEGIRLERK